MGSSPAANSPEYLFTNYSKKKKKVQDYEIDTVITPIFHRHSNTQTINNLPRGSSSKARIQSPLAWSYVYYLLLISASYANVRLNGSETRQRKIITLRRVPREIGKFGMGNKSPPKECLNKNR